MDSAKQKKRHVHPREKEDSKGHLSSGSETTLGEGEGPGPPPKLMRQLSNAEGNPLISETASSESSERGEAAPSLSSLTGNGFNPITTATTTTTITGSSSSTSKPTVEKSVLKVEDVVVAPPSSNNTSSTRTYSESSVSPALPPVTTQAQADMPGKSQTAPTTSTTGEGEEKRNYFSSKFKFQRKVLHNQEGNQMVGVSEESSTYLFQQNGVSDPPGHVTPGLEASSSSSLSDHLPGTDKPHGGNGKKKISRGKQKQLKLDFQELTIENVVKCTLNTNTGQVVEFRFSTKYDKPVNIFREFVSFEMFVIVL